MAVRADEKRRGHDRREPRRVEFFGLDRRERLFRIKVTVNRKQAAMPEDGDAGQIERADMIERPDDQKPRVRVQSKRHGLIGGFPVNVVIGEHHALGPVRGA
jgi:hypothetical protein